MHRLIILSAALAVMLAAGSAMAEGGCFGGYSVHVPSDTTIADSSGTDVVKPQGDG